MKKSFYILSLVALFVVLPSCKDEFLEEEPYDFLSPGNFYKNKADAIAAVNSVYDVMQGEDLWGRWYWMMSDFPSEQMTNNRDGGDRGALDKLIWDSNNEGFFRTWRGFYRGINRANTVIARVPGIQEIDEDTRNRVVAEAKFLRGMYYFYLMSFYRNVPFIDKETTSLDDAGDVTNEGTADDVWNLILEDLKEAEQVLPDSYTGNDVGRATKGAAKGLLARVYMQRSGLGVANEWALAAAKAKEIIDSQVYQLNANYGDNFSIATENSKESIFAVQYGSGIGEGNNLGAMTGPRGGKMLTIDQWSSATGEPEFFNSFNQDDQRMAATWILEFNRVDNGKTEKYPESQFMPLPHLRKYIHLGAPATGDFALNYNVLRYADVLLMHSEAENMANGPSPQAVFGINEVRKRAGLELLDPAALDVARLNEVRTRAKLPPIAAGASAQEILRQYIIQERAWELCFEGQAFHDYVRQGVLEERAATVGHTGVDPKRYYYPIPQRELDVNPLLKQNAGY